MFRKATCLFLECFREVLKKSHERFKKVLFHNNIAALHSSQLPQQREGLFLSNVLVKKPGDGIFA